MSIKKIKAKGITKNSLVTDQVVHQDVFIWNARGGFMGWFWTTAITGSHRLNLLALAVFDHVVD